jgi:hypothetical protein
MKDELLALAVLYTSDSRRKDFEGRNYKMVSSLRAGVSYGSRAKRLGQRIGHITVAAMDAARAVVGKFRENDGLGQRDCLEASDCLEGKPCPAA